MSRMNKPWVKAWVRLGDLLVDRRYQGDLQKKRVKYLVDHWDDRIGYIGIAVSRRADGTLWIIDGQHRVAALLEAEFSNIEIEVCLYEGLSLEDEAALFSELQGCRTHSLWERFNAKVLGGLDPERSIDRVFTECGWKRARNEGLRCVCALGAAKYVFLRHGSDALRHALTIIALAWRYESGSASRTLLMTLGRLCGEHSGEFEQKKMAEKLSKESWARLAANIEESARVRRCGIEAAGIEVLMNVYNKRRRNLTAAA